MLKTRILTAIVALCVVLALLYAASPVLFALVVLAVLTAGAHEWCRMARLAGWRALLFVAVFVVAGLALLLAPAAHFADGWPAPLVLGVCGVATLFWLAVATPWVIGRWQPRNAVVLALAGWVVLLGALVGLVSLKARSPSMLLAAMAIVWIADTAAYFTGRAVGRRKLAPSVSPGKTWEGVYGALAAVAVYAIALGRFGARSQGIGPLPAGAMALFVAFVVAVAALSVIGDLFESWQKRQAGLKDSGTLLPGHGGVLDRVDALVAAIPPLACAAVLVFPR